MFAFEHLGADVTDGYLAGVLDGFGIDAGDARALCPGYGNARPLGLVATDKLMRAPMIEMAEIRRKAGTAPTWTAEFRRPSTVTLAGPLRAAHCVDMQFYVDRLDLPSAARVCGADLPQPLADRMHRCIVDVVSGRNPGWPAWAESRESRTWDGPETGITGDLSAVHACVYGA